MLTKSDGILIILGCIVGILATVVIFPLVMPATGPSGTTPTLTPAIPEKIPVITGTVTTVDQLTSKEDVIAFIYSHTDTATAATSYDYSPVVVPGGARSFTFDVDTSTFKPDEYIVTAAAIKEDATGVALFNVVDAQSGTRGPVPTETPLPRVTNKNGYYITINPVSDKRVGDRFGILGFTNLPADEEILVQVYSSSFKPTQKSQSGEFSGATGTVKTTSSSVPVPVPTLAPLAVKTAAPTIAQSAGEVGDRQFSKTNVQVKEVDEGDIIKTDGENIYVITRNCMHIVKAYPAKNAEILSTLRFAGSPQELYINNDNVVLIATDYWTRPVTECKPGQCYNEYSSTPRTLVYVFSVTNPAKPQEVRELAIDGSYTSSRMIGSDLYFVTSTPIPGKIDDLELPVIHDDHGGITTPGVYGFNATDRSYAFSTIGSFDLATKAPVQAKSFLIGTAGTIYVSPTHLYLAVPDTAYYRNAPSTTIHSFTIDSGKITYAAGGRIDGTLLSQYSLDEYDGNLRVATTIGTDSWRMGSGSYSKITVLDRNLDILGTLPDIAPGERIYSARFMGDRLYLVTFRQTDPFYVIGLADPKHPVILGELKLPGFSNYLHPYDANHVIGIGKESQSGPVKLALFDVSDVNNPTLMDSETLGGPYSNSPVLDDPKALLFDKEKNILVLPLHLQGDSVCSPQFGCRSPEVWGGAYVFGVNPKTGFVLKGMVTHYNSYIGTQDPVKRSLYIEQMLYTMSDAKIMISDLGNSLNRVNQINFR